MPWKQDINGKWGNFDDLPGQEPTLPGQELTLPVESQQNSSQQNSTIESHMNPSMELQHQYQHEDLPEKRQPPYEGRWILDSDGEKLIYVVAELPPVPKFVIPLPSPPSDCGSAFQSDSSLTVSQYTADPNFLNRTFDEIDRSAHSQMIGSDQGDEADTINDNNDSIGNFYSTSISKTKTSICSGQKSNKSSGSTAVETADMTQDLEGQGYPQSIFRQGNSHSKENRKKRVLIVEPKKSWKEEKEEHLRIQEKIRKTKRREICCRKTVYVLVFLSFLAITVGGGLSAMVYFNVIDLDNLGGFFGINSTNTIDESDDFNNVLFETPLPTSSPIVDTEEPTSNPTASPTTNGPSIENTFIIDTLSGQFRINLPWDNPLAPPNRAVDWMTKELKSVGKGHFEYQYDNMGKFGQRFALLATQYSLLGDAIDMDQQPFFFDKQMGVDECDWEGVGCDAYGRVIELDFSDLDLTGIIPSEIRYLFKLESLDLSSNRITGNIPKNLYDLRNLKKLYLYQNELTGTLSTWIGQLDSLEYLHLSQNLLSGSIPEQLRSYSYSVLNPLIYLNLYDNQLTGTIPNNLNLGKIYYFDIGRNYISGSIPTDIGTDYTKLKFLHIDHNRLTSSIPDTIPIMANGRMISLLANNNRLSGVIPGNWIMYNKLVQYTIHENYFSYMEPENCKMNVFSGGQCVEFKADCNICSCRDNFCDTMCSINN